MDFKAYRLEEAPPTVYYVPDFITSEEEDKIISNVYAAPKPKWTQLSNRRLQNWGGIPHVKGMITEKIPEWLTMYTEKIGQLGVFGNVKPNHILVNEYLPGQGIMPHLDGPLFYPTVTTISCGSHTMLDFKRPILTDENETDTSDHGPDTKILSLLLERRSLLILQDDMYHKYMHSIAEVEDDIVTDKVANLKTCGIQYIQGQTLKRSTRISLTIRHVPRTSRFQIRLGK
ncbi:alpha-ketoglutarate-dependent dioxygenase alkB homolog 6 isoform X1 [Anabrus simplex]|uniref:alpha-ketoglutarate-dependent dioxygenase alkB homolog 6 isoform X1 n=1 Tax=Anabrus simplex TaxID=316456 RepID=UPI0034DCF199